MVRFLILYETTTDAEAFERHYRTVHVPLALELPGLRSYTISREVTVVRGEGPLHLVGQLEWEDMDALRAAFASPQGVQTAEDVANLAALSPGVRSMIYEVEELLAPA